MTLQIPFDNSFARLPEGFAAQVAPTPVVDPRLVLFNRPLAEQLGITGRAKDAELAQIFSGNRAAPGAQPLAQLYAGHQFGQFNPQLGDGRAVLLGEVVDATGTRRDIQLKGAGRTPFSRMGDGRAWLGPVLREYVVSEAMHALGVPTTRALAAVTTGEIVLRERPLPGAVLTRVAQSHLRVGSFQVFAARGQTDLLRQLFDYTVDRHMPQADTPEAFLAEVIRRQVDLVAQWLSLGFIHGVMNTDNCAISGETIDYGPCAFMDIYDPDTVFSSIDRFGRYAYAAQADIILWNMAQLASALVPLMPDEDRAVEQFTAQVNAMGEQIRAAWLARFGRKIGLAQATPQDAPLIGRYLSLLQRHKADFTNGFRALTRLSAPADLPADDDTRAWEQDWLRRLEQEDDPAATMRQANPALIPRNHRVEQMIDAAVRGDMAPLHRMMAALSDPWQERAEYGDLAQPPAPAEVVQATFCGT